MRLRILNILNKLKFLNKLSIKKSFKIKKKKTNNLFAYLLSILLILVYISLIFKIKNKQQFYLISNIFLILMFFYLFFKYKNYKNTLIKYIDEKFNEYDTYNQFLKMKYENEKYYIKCIEYDNKVFDIQNMNNLVIGKNNSKCNIDLDLSQHEYSALVSKVHAILNKTNNIWYIEDVASKNGVYLQREGSVKNRLSLNKKYELHVGDIVYISIIKLTMK